MSVTSGSPTQIKSYVAAIADLAGLPDDAYDAGDMAFVASVAQTFRLRRTALGAVPDNVNTVDTFTGNGYWEVFGGVPGTMLAVDTIADLALLVDATMGDGQQVFVRSVRSPFTLRNGVVAADGITIVSALSATKTWFRSALPKMWNAQTTFYLGGAAANDEGDGTVAAPLATLGELQRRIYDPVSPRTNAVTVNVVGNILESSQFTTNVQTTFQGALTALHSAVPLNAGGAGVTNAVITPAPCVLQEITCPALTFGASNLLKLSNDGGATFHQSGFTSADPPANTAQTHVCQALGLATLVNTDTIYEYTLFRLRARFTAEAVARITFTNLIVAGYLTNTKYATFNECVLGDNAGFFPADKNLVLLECTEVTIWTSKFVRSTSFDACSTVFIAGSVVSENAVVQATNSHLSLGADVALNQGEIDLYVGSRLSLPTGNIELDGNFGLIKAVDAGVVIDLGSNGGAVWGLSPGATPIQIMKTNTVLLFRSTMLFTNDGSYSHADGAGGTVTALLATLPGAPSLLQMPNYNVGIIPDR